MHSHDGSEISTLDLAGEAFIMLATRNADRRAHYSKSVGRTPDGRDVILKLGVSGQVIAIELRT